MTNLNLFTDDSHWLMIIFIINQGVFGIQQKNNPQYPHFSMNFLNYLFWAACFKHS